MTAPIASGVQGALISFAVRFRGTVVALACLLVVYSVYALGQARYDVFPEFAPPQVSVQTEAPGLTPEQVEMLVTDPIETALNGAPGVETMRSTSIQGLSVVKVFFTAGSDIYRDRQLVGERLASVIKQLPQGVGAPTVTPLTSSTSNVLVIGLTSHQRSQMELHTLAEWTMRLRLLAVPGVADVTLFGGDTRSIQIQVHPEKLVQYGLALSDVANAARTATGVRGAGFIETKNQRLVLETEGQSLTPQEIGQTVIASQGSGRVRLVDVADVRDAPAPTAGAALIDGQRGVVLNISEQYGANTVEVTRGVEAALAELRPGLIAQGVELHADLFRPANFITTALHNVRTSLILGGILVVVVLFLFLFHLRTAAVACTAIPLSLFTATLVLELLGVSLNTMTLGGLAIAIGEVVDDAVIGIENIAHRLRQNGRLEAPRSPGQVVVDAVFEVRSAVVYATVAVILVFLPIIALPGLGGRLFGPLALAYILAVVASLFVALLVTPALAMVLLVRHQEAVEDPPVVRWLRGRYERLLSRLTAKPKTVITVAILFTLLSCATIPLLGGEFLPELKEGHFIVHVSAAPGTSIAESERLGARVTEALKAVPGVRTVAERIGRAPRGDDTWGTHYGEVEIDLRPMSAKQAAQTEKGIRSTLASFIGLNASVETFLTERIQETLSGFTAPVAVNVFGNDLDALDSTVQGIARVLGAVKGARDVQIQSPPGLPQLTIRFRKADLLRWGLAPADVLDAVRTAYQGDVVGQTYEGTRVFDVITILDAASRDDVERIGSLPIRSPSGTFVQLGQIADIFPAPGRYQIQHEGARRLGTVTTDVAGRDVQSFVHDAQSAIAANIKLPPGTYISFAGTAQAQQLSRRALILNSLVAGIGIVVLLGIVTGHWRNLLLVLANLPFALTGGLLAVLITGATLSLGSMIGFVTLFGITLRNSIMMISRFEQLVGVEGRRWGLQTAIKGAADRLVPILMTSLVTGLGLLPLAIGMNDPGREIEGPMAVVILGGLMTSMALNLLVLPTLAVLIGRFEMSD